MKRNSIDISNNISSFYVQMPSEFSRNADAAHLTRKLGSQLNPQFTIQDNQVNSVNSGTPRNNQILELKDIIKRQGQEFSKINEQMEFLTRIFRNQLAGNAGSCLNTMALF